MASRHRLANFKASGDQFQFDIQTDDSAGDDDFNDFVLTCTAIITQWDHIVYGTIRTYSGLCRFNPCFPRSYLVIDSLEYLKELLSDQKILEILKRLYPLRIRPLLHRPIPDPDPGPFRPLMIPTGLPDEPGISVIQRDDQRLNLETNISSGKDESVLQDQRTGLSLISGTLQKSAILAKEDRLTLAKIKDKYSFRRCTIKPASQMILRFLEYDRTESEKVGDPYSGEGGRSVLGITASDELGNFIFRFTQSVEMVVEELTDIGISEDVATEIRPDLIIQILESLPEGVAHETAPYYNIPNIRRINLCLPSDVFQPPRKACQGGRAIQALGNISILIPNTLHADGTVSNTSSTGPQVNHAAWYGIVDLFACFLDTVPAVKYYTIRYRREEVHDGISTWTPWDWVNQYYQHPKKQSNGSWKNEKIGPDARSLRVNGPSNPKEPAPSYLNIENQIVNQDWQNAWRDRKLRIDTRIYQPVAGKTDFWIEGYDETGEKVTAANDVIRLYIDNGFSAGDIVYAKPVGASDPGDCALFSIPSANEPFAVKFRIVDKEGFLKSYKLNVYRGSNTPVTTKDLSTNKAVSELYGSLDPVRFNIISDRFFGTKDLIAADLDGYVEITVVPTGTSWLPPDRDACCFSFELSSIDRVTNGYSVPTSRLLWRELIGISHKSTP
ncbi:MAG: hypothetical protein JW999_00035 [Methanotrichaceae archaeon]|nr:hypothetical protein [Methanotrichaceae archaeon]